MKKGVGEGESNCESGHHYIIPVMFQFIYICLHVMFGDHHLQSREDYLDF